jgi:hypothetical protein
MSKTVKARLEWALSDLVRGAEAMDLPHGVNVRFRVFGGRRRVELHLPARTLLDLGAERVRYSDGVGFVENEGILEAITDHYNLRDGRLTEDLALAVGKIAARGRAEAIAETWRGQGLRVEVMVQEGGEVVLHRHSPGSGGYARA